MGKRQKPQTGGKPLARLSKSIVKEVAQYAQLLGEGSAKPSRKFMGEMLLGLTLSGGVMLSQAARRLVSFEEITFHALHKKLCRGLKSSGWCAMDAQWNYLEHVKMFLPSSAVIACDLGDITKPRSRKMPGLRTVRDGSTGALKKGWWLVEIEAVCRRGPHLALWLELFSVARGSYKSQRTTVESAITFIVERIGRGQLWVLDRGFDGWEYFRFFGRERLRFAVRCGGRRIVETKTGKCSISALAHTVEESARFVWGRKRTKTGYVIKVAYARIIIPQSGQELTLIVARGFGRHPLLLLTNEVVAAGADAVELVRAYRKRWGVEEAGRLVKQAFDLENLRALSWTGLVKLTWLAMWAYGFACLLRLKARRLAQDIINNYPAFGRLPKYPYYRLAGGLALCLAVFLPAIKQALEECL